MSVPRPSPDPIDAWVGDQFDVSRPAPRRPDIGHPRRGVVWIAVRRDDGGLVTVKEHIVSWGPPLRVGWMIVYPIGGGSDLIRHGPIFRTWQEAVERAIHTVDGDE